MKLLARWLVNSVALVVAAYLLPKIDIASWQAAVIAGALLGLLNTFVRPVLRLVSLPINLLTMGLFTLVINGAILMILDWLMEGLTISGFLWAIVGALVVSILTSIVNIVIGE